MFKYAIFRFCFLYSKKDPGLVSKTIGCLSYMLGDENINVTKRVMLACNSLYKLALQVNWTLNVTSLPVCFVQSTLLFSWRPKHCWYISSQLGITNEIFIKVFYLRCSSVLFIVCKTLFFNNYKFKFVP